jgi:hypothetical protein
MMTVKVTLEYNSVDEAIVALGKLIGTPLAPAKERKGRADAGQKRGEYKPRETKGAPASATGIPPEEKPQGAIAATGNSASGVTESRSGDPAASSTVPQAPGPAPSAAATAAGAQVGSTTAGAPPLETIGDKDADAQTAIAKIYSLKGIAAVQGLLKNFGVNRVRDVPKAKRDEFLKAAAEAAA